MTQATTKHDLPTLDQLTGGVFTAATSGERAQRVRDWLAGNPSPELMQEVFKELSGRDKGAARALRERLDEIKRAKGQEVIAAEWAEKARSLLDQPRLNIADAMAWQRDAAKAGAPLSREPLAGLKANLAERVKGVEDLQHRAQVHREAAVLLAQRFEVLSTKGWQDAQAAEEGLRADVAHWTTQADEITQDPNWASLDARFALQLDASRSQLQVVSEAFHSALAQAVAAAADAQAPLPPVPVWADELRAARGLPPENAPAPAAPPAPKVDPAQRAAAESAVEASLTKLEEATAQGQGKSSQAAANALRAVLKEHGKLVGNALEARVHAALVAAGELEGWQRWGADKVREELVAKAEGLLNRPEGQALGGRKMQEQLRALREQWKQADQGGVPNHGLWRRFDEACNKAHKVVEAWLEKVRAEAAEHRAQRLALIEELRAWTTEHASDADLKARNRALHQFSDRWRDGGHVSEKVFAELQPLWSAAMNEARGPLEASQKASIERRQQMIAEATELGAAPQLRIDAVKALQQRWQAEAQAVPLERRQEQKLWDAFRKPIDDAFQRKSAERERQTEAMGEHDRAVLEASKALEAANATGDAQKIRAAMTALEDALRGRREAAAPAGTAPAAAAPAGDTQAADAGSADATVAPTDVSTQDGGAEGGETSAPAPAPAPKAAPRPVVAVRGDDRPGAARPAAAPAGRFGDRRDARDGRGGPRAGDRNGDRFGRDRPGRPGDMRGDRPPREDRGPRLGDTAFRAQRDAMEHAQAALRKLASQAHGEAVTQLLDAWSKRDAAAVPPAQELGRVSPSVRNQWVQSLSSAPSGEPAEALLRLEMAAEVPTPPEQLDARRALQLKLLTKRNEPGPAETWAQDAARVLASAHEPTTARRLQSALKPLLRKG
ncbi:DUF349 domain-containing protein [uncultured Pseudacidovorax sp.]|uniref:DUF349 domain-containing protein n=1 Tax=uncultured Pseudacidovorax sp. TaxID=679313 RepID=UPI0025F98E26|nr:DUF349 domain-containing protein [uncultured Pseudacidovorax sp.]